MKISDLKAGATNVDLEATVVEKDDPREVITKYGKKVTVASATLKDDSGSIVLSLWGKDADGVNIGDKVKISNGYVGEFKGTPQLSAGKYGKIEVVGSGDVPAKSGKGKAEEEEFSEDVPTDE